MKGIDCDYLCQISFFGRDGHPVNGALTSDDLVQLWHHYEELDDVDAMLAIAKALAQLPDDSDLLIDDPSIKGLSAVSKSHSPSYVHLSAPRPLRGKKGISTKQKRAVRQSCHVLENRAPVNHYVFATATIPSGLNLFELKTLCVGWADIRKAFKQSLQKYLEKLNLPSDFIIITEIQEKRYLKEGRVYPHLHVVFNYSGQYFLLKNFQKWIDEIWSRILSNKLNRKIETPYACNVQQVKKSLANELSKYLSKGGKIVDRIIKDGRSESLPNFQAIISTDLRKECEKNILKFEGEAISLFEDNFELLKEAGFVSGKRIYVQIWDETSPTNYREICVGIAGYVKKPHISIFEHLFSSPEMMKGLIEIIERDRLALTG